MNTALITGATGFIGQWLTRELLEHGIRVYAVVRPGTENMGKLPEHKGLTVVPCDLRDYGKLPEQLPEDASGGIDVCYHLAWEGVSGPKSTDYRIQLKNVEALMELTAHLTRLGVKKFIAPGSMHEIESQIEMEKHEPCVNMGMMYKGAKHAAHYMSKADVCRQNIDFLWPVVTNAYGVGERSQRLINSAVRSLLKGESPAFTKGDQYYDFVYISDVARAFRLIGEHGVSCKPYVIGSGHARPLKEFLIKAGELVAPEIPLRFGAHIFQGVYVPKEYYDENEALLRRDTGFRPQVSFEEGIGRLAAWMKETEASEV